MSTEIVVPVDRFEAMENILMDQGVIDHDEWFCRGGATFIARGQVVTINPKAFNGTSWIVEVSTEPVALN